MIGIVGGMGTMAGIHFAKRLVDLNNGAIDDSLHAPFILHSEPSIPDRAAAYFDGSHSPAGMISDAVNHLATSGAHFGVIICNTAHIFFDEIVAKSKIPLVNMVEQTVEYATAAGITHIGLLATTATVQSKIYQRNLRSAGIEVFVPGEATQEAINKAIFDKSFGLKSKGTHIDSRAVQIIREASAEMHRNSGVRHFILGCTELSMIGDHSCLDAFVHVDPVDLLALACLKRIGLMPCSDA